MQRPSAVANTKLWFPALTVLLTTATVASLIGMVLVNAEKNRTLLAWKEASLEQERIRAALVAESKARWLTRDVLNAVTEDLVQETTARRAALTEADRAFLRRVLAHFELFIAEQGESEESRAIRAEGALRVADLRRRLGEPDAAANAYRAARELFTALYSERPHSADYRRDLAATLANEGLLLHDLGKYKEALANYEGALGPLTSLIRESADDHKSRWNLAKLLANIADTKLKAADFRGAEKAFDSSLETIASAHAKLPMNRFRTQDYSRILNNFGALLTDRGRREHEAERLFRDAIGELESLVESTNGLPAFRQDLATVKANLGKLFISWKRHPEALIELRAAAAIQEELASRFPVLGIHRLELASTQTAIGTVSAELGESEFAKEFDAAEAALKTLLSEHPCRTDYKQALAEAWDAKGLVALNTRRADALTAFRKAAALRDEIAAAEPEHHQYFLDRLATRINIADVYRCAGRFNTALAIYRAVDQEVADRAELPARHARRLVFGLGDCLMHANEFAAALECWDHLVKDRGDPDWAKFELQRAIACVRFGRVDEGLKAAADVLSRPTVKPVLHYEVARCCAVAIGAAKSNADCEEKLARQAITHLEDAAAASFFRDPRMLARIHRDADLLSLRPRADYRRFLRRHGLEGQGR